MKKGLKIRLSVSCMFALLTLFLFSVSALAADTGWKKIGDEIYYFYAAGSDSSVTTNATGLQKINKKYYYFNTAGVMQTGWVSTQDGFRYFKTTGEMGVIGRMYTGWKIIDGARYYFNGKGIPATGLTTVKGNTYYFSKVKTAGQFGRAVQNKWVSVKKALHYFGPKGIMVTNAWVNNRLYVDGEGNILKNTVTPDGYLVNEKGKKVSNAKVNGWVKINKKYYYFDLKSGAFKTKTFLKVDGKMYYVDKDGIRVKGWQNIGKYRYYFLANGEMQTGLTTIKGKNYYFNSRGRLQINTTVDGYITDENGVAVRDPNAKPKILIMSGHGQGDVGASSKWGYEANYTRQFGKLIYDCLKDSAIVDADYYKNGDINYDCYQQNLSLFRDMQGQITGTGNVKSTVASRVKAGVNVPDFTEYDYVLEVHFNAKGSGKDPDGNGSYTGVGFYINSYRYQYGLENDILNRIVNLGFKRWGGGIFTSSGLFNARICQELGVKYGLLETAFIDDGDDMRFYTNNKEKMARAVADGIENYFK